MHSNQPPRNFDTENLVYQQSECLATEAEIHKAIEKMALQINQDLKNSFPLILVVMSGALVVSGQLLPKLNFPLDLDFCRVSRYATGTQGVALKWLSEPKTSFVDRDILIVDDIYDEGATLVELVKDCFTRGAKKISTCVLINKIHDRKKDKNFIPEYVGMEMPDRFLVGYGMDYNGLGRNLPGIFAID